MRAMHLMAGLLLCAASQAGTVGDYDSCIPLVHDGGGWTTEITVVNLGKESAQVQVEFLTLKGYAEPWKIKLKTSSGKLLPTAVDASIAAGGLLVIETGGDAENLVRGYARVVVFNSVRVGATAQVKKTAGGRLERGFTVPMLPELEEKAAVPLRLEEGASAEMVWVSGTASTILDLTFRKPDGTVAAAETIDFADGAQIFVPLLERWPALKGFQGVMEWVVWFPGADRYEPRFLTGMALGKRADGSEVAFSAMTLPGNQKSSSPY